MILRMWLIGDVDRDEMRPVTDWIRARTSAETLRVLAAVSPDSEHDSSNWLPDLIVVLESHPDEYSPADVARCFAAVPSARLVCCAGAWSESAGRTRKIWPLATRVAAVSAIPRLEREWWHLTNQSTLSPLPATGSREEWFAEQHPADVARDGISGVQVAVETPDAAYRAMLTELLTAHGCRVSFPTSSEPSPSVLLWDADPWNADRAQALQTCRTLLPQTPVVAVSGWITPELERELLAQGVHAVLPKLGDQHRLLDVLSSGLR